MKIFGKTLGACNLLSGPQMCRPIARSFPQITAFYWEVPKVVSVGLKKVGSCLIGRHMEYVTVWIITHVCRLYTLSGVCFVFNFRAPEDTI